MADLELQSLAGGRERFLEWVAEYRPQLHRYCARMMGSAIDGEDVLQESLAKAFYQLSQSVSVPPLRPWLLRIAHHTALDHLKRYERKHVEPLDELTADTLGDGAIDPASVRAALATFLELPVLQRSAVILKDVLGLSNEDIASTLQTTVPAVKAGLVRGRAKLKAATGPAPREVTLSPELRATLDTYVARFNARDWDGLRTLLAKEVELDLVARASRRGAEVGQYFGNYAKDDVTLTLGQVDGRPVLGVFKPGATSPAYVIQLEVADDGVRFIRDYRYVTWLEFTFLPLPEEGERANKAAPP
ncbi:MAG: RNA polymerase sigma factor [Archangium sp.]|nr:RNA polymerase sigma factor [Archangium sp.]